MVKVNDVYATSWGYDQTNYDFIVVTGISPTGKTAKCRRAHANFKGNDGYGCDLLEPTTEAFGEEFRMKVEKNGNLRGSYPFLHTGEGSRRLDTFYLADTKSQYHQTDVYHGH